MYTGIALASAASTAQALHEFRARLSLDRRSRAAPDLSRVYHLPLLSLSARHSTGYGGLVVVERRERLEVHPDASNGAGGTDELLLIVLDTETSAFRRVVGEEEGHDVVGLAYQHLWTVGKAGEHRTARESGRRDALHRGRVDV